MFTRALLLAFLQKDISGLVQQLLDCLLHTWLLSVGESSRWPWREW